MDFFLELYIVWGQGRGEGKVYVLYRVLEGQNKRSLKQLKVNVV